MTNDFLLVLEVTWTGIDVPHYKVPYLCTSEKIETTLKRKLQNEAEASTRVFYMIHNTN